MNSSSDEEEEKEEGEEEKQDETEDVDFKSISGNINYVNVDNMFYDSYKIKLSYTNYCCITEDFTTKQLNMDAIKTVESFGFPQEFIINSLNEGYINHATASYYLLN